LGKDILKRIGLIVNPYAGIGGRVGLKGSDGLETRKKALELGAIPLSPKRTVEALRELDGLDGFVFITYPGSMGEYEVREAGFEPEVIGVTAGDTSAEDTKRAASELLQKGIDLLVFSGGDGTARDIYSVVGDQLPVLGIPTGVKIHSGVYAVDPRSAGVMMRRFISGSEPEVRLTEVMDIDEEAFRDNVVQARLFGYMNALYNVELIQGSKESSGSTDESATIGAANEIVDEMESGVYYVLGPGSTIKPIADRLEIKKTLLGVDVVLDKKLVASDVNEKQLLELITGKKTTLYVTVIGGQGFVFGRGNQQLSPAVIRMIGKQNINVIATPNKLATLRGKHLRVDTGDQTLDEELKGYHKLHTGYARRTIYRVA
jgi:predicted polyphosphate/ATP-dependent NAD kinase